MHSFHYSIFVDLKNIIIKTGLLAHWEMCSFPYLIRPVLVDAIL